MRALIIGCGYVGLQLGAELVRRGHSVWGVRRSAAAGGQLREAGITPVLADITRMETLSRLPASIDWVILCASASGGGAESYRQVYLQGAQNLLCWCEAGQPEKFIYTSSTGVYGQIDGSLVDESSPTNPSVETAKVLVEAEQILLKAARERRFPVAVLRVAGIYGPSRGYWLKSYLSGEARIEGDGNRMLNMIHREDVVGVVVAALEQATSGAIYNAVDNEPVSQRSCFEWLSTKLGKGLPPFVPEQQPGPLGKRGWTNKRVSNRKLRLELGYRFRYPTFREGFTAELGRMEGKEPGG